MEATPASTGSAAWTARQILDAPRGFEPRLTESESVVLPLDEGASGRLVRPRGIEPPRDYSHNDLNVARLPTPPRPQNRPENTLQYLV